MCFFGNIDTSTKNEMTTNAVVTVQGYLAYNNIDDNVRYRDDEILVVRSFDRRPER
jgi:hypothetical protein